MATIDNKIVSIKFDNEAFQRNVAETLRSLDQLNSSLNLTGAGRGLNELGAAARRVDLSPVGASVDGVSAKFLALATIGIATLTNLTNKAVNAGINISKAFTFDPAMQGFREYETNMRSIQTILANTDSKGTNLNQVTAALDQMNTYSDQTIYNFSEMARNIGTFTAAGVDLERATQSIKGIANLAAISGSSSEQAATAMYQLSQAIAAGSVKLMDWNSVVNAGMGGEVFQKALFETGKALGTLKNVPMDQTFEQWKNAGNSFRQSLSDTSLTVEDTGNKVQQAQQQADKMVASARKAQAQTASRGADSIARAQESMARSFERADKSIENAIENQTRTIETNAQSQKAAIDRVTDAQKRLDEAMKPASTDELEAATDNLTSAQLDQKDLADAVTQAMRDQQRASEDLKQAKRALAGAGNSEQRREASRRIEDAEARVLDLTDAVTRAKLQQNAANRNLHDAEKRLNEVKKKGSAEDENLIDARDGLADAQKALAETTEDNAKREIEAAEAVKQAELDAIRTREDAIKSLADAQENAADANIAASERVADAVEAAAERVKNANNDAGGMKAGWLTDKVLTTTLASFTGDLSEAQLMQLGYSQEQAREMIRLGKLGKAAATEVKTFSQLMQTVKESIGSGWAETFRNIIGDFNESKKLFTGMNAAIGEVVQRSADARNAVLKEWKDLGGRDFVIEGFKNALKALHALLGPIAQAFRDIFPRKTAQMLVEMSQSFANFTRGLIVTAETSDKIRRTFAGFFAVLEIGWTVFKGIVGLIATIIRSLSGVGTGVLGATAGVGDFLVALNHILVDGKGIENFFLALGKAIKTPVDFLRNLTSAIFEFFGAFSESNVLDEAGKNIEKRFSALSGVSERLGKVWDRLGKVFKAIGEWFSQLGKQIGEALGPNPFGQVLDAINTGLLAGLTVLIAKFVKNGLKLNVGGGLLDNVTKSIKELTGVLKAMQFDLKAKALLKIAIAIGIIAASVLVLASIKPEALTAALLAMTTGFSEMIAVFAVLNAMTSGPMAAAKLAILAGGLIALATAMAVMSLAVKNLSSLSWDEMQRGLTGLGAGILIMISAMKALPPTPGLIASSIAMMAMATSMIILAKAVKSFSDLSWGEMAKGLIGVAAGLGILAGAMHLMPPHMAIMSIGLIGVATALLILAKAVQAFADIKWGDLLHGLVGIGGGLLVIAGAMHLMPPHMILTATGLLILSAALNVMAKAVEAMGGLKMGELAKGIGAIAAMLVILAVGVTAMTGTLGGAAALLVVSGALLILSGVLKVLGSMSIAQIVTSLLALAGVLAVLGVGAALLTPVIPMLLSLGAALTLIGTGMILFGAGAYLVAKAFTALVKAGKAGIQALVDIIKVVVTALPEIATALAKSLLDFAEEILKGTPVIVRLMKELLIQLLDTIIEVSPKLAQALIVFITQALLLIREKFPDFLKTGFELLIQLLKGIRDNIDEIVKVAVQIVVTLVDAITDNAGKLVAAAANLIIGFIKAIGDKIGDIVTAGVDIVLALLQGIADNTIRFATAAADIVIGFINSLAKVIEKKTPELITAGVNLVEAIGKGILKGLKEIPVVGQVLQLGEDILGGLAGIFGIKSPAKEFIKIARYAVQGLVVGFKDNSAKYTAVKQGQTLVKAFQDSINRQSLNLNEFGEFQPVITPVLDLTRVRQGAKELDGLMSISTITPTVSIDHAQSIAKTTDFAPKEPEIDEPLRARQISFVQNNYAPKALSTNDIYRNTRSQITLAKEELSIP